jgi:putative phosphoesterase
MKIAILSDIHGNVVALEAVLQDLQGQGKVDHILVPGDMFAYGPAPAEVLATLQSLNNASFLSGNSERYYLEGSYPIAATGDDWQDRLLLSFRWTAERLGHEGLRFIEALPRYQVIQWGARHLLAVHGSPHSDEEGLTAQTGDECLRAMIGPQVAVLVCGHTHTPMMREIDGTCVVNVGSVGLPFDGDPRACYALVADAIGNDASPAHVELRRVPYNVEEAVAQFYARDYPAADISAYNLRSARSLGSNPIYTPRMSNRSALAR